MTLDKAKRIANKLRGADVSCELLKDYRGRGSFGIGTAAVTVHEQDEFDRSLQLCRSLRDCRQDAMGLGVVFY